MDDQWPFTDDFVAADDWFLSQQPFWAVDPPDQSYQAAQVIGRSTDVNLDMWPAQGYEDHNALSMPYDPSWIALSPSDQGPAANVLGFGTLQNVSPAEAAVDYGAHAALSPPQTQHIVMSHFEARNISAANPKRRTTYLRSTCATCEAPLDTSELVLHIESPQLWCTRSKAPDHLPLYCLHTDCGLKFKDLNALRQHSELSKHVSVQCGVPSCITSLCMSAVFVDEHYGVAHGDLEYSCAECNKGFKIMNDLSSHGTSLHHNVFLCEYPGCDSAAATIWDLHRHELKHRKNVQGYPCPRCPRYRGDNSFKRKDHLRQHMRNFHLVADVPRSGRRGPFSCKFRSCVDITHSSSLAELTTHMLEVHHSMPYVCNETGCLRIGMSGFETQKLLKLHSKNDHVSAYQCKQLGCDRVGNNGWKRKADAIKHMKKQHGAVETYSAPRVE